MTSMSLADYHSKFPNGHKAKKGRNKFNASKVTLDGMTFDSKKNSSDISNLKPCSNAVKSLD